MTRTKLHLNNPKVKYFVINSVGRILSTGDRHKKDWEDVYVHLDLTKIKSPIFVSFNKKENEKIGKEAVYVKLQYSLNKIEYVNN